MTAVIKPESSAVVLAKPVADIGTLRRMIFERFKTIQSLLPAHMTPERFAALVISAAVKSPKLFLCTGESILNSIHEAASLGLEINSATGEGYLIPYKDTAKFMPGYRGLVKLAIQSREVLAIEARLVYEGEQRTFGVFYGTDSRIEHVPNFEIDREPDAVIAGYAVAKLPGGTATFEVMTRKQLDGIWARSKSKNDGPWITDREEMYRKTITRRICKYIPMSPRLSQALELDNEVEGIESNGPRQISTGTQQLNAALRGESPTPATDDEADLLAQDRALAAKEGQK